MSLYSRSATMTCHENPGLLRRILTALGGALKRGILGKSSHDYMKQFTGSDEYWDRAMAARLAPESTCSESFRLCCESGQACQPTCARCKSGGSGTTAIESTSSPARMLLPSKLRTATF